MRTLDRNPGALLEPLNARHVNKYTKAPWADCALPSAPLPFEFITDYAKIEDQPLWPGRLNFTRSFSSFQRIQKAL